jgi:hypothetical protein
MLNIKYILEMFEEVYHAKYQLDRRNVWRGEKILEFSKVILCASFLNFSYI